MNEDYTYVIVKDKKEETKETTFNYDCIEEYDCTLYPTDVSINSVNYTVVKPVSKEPNVYEVTYDL